MGSSPYNIKHMVNNVACSVKHFERTDTLEIHECGELTVVLERGRSQGKSSLAAADFSLMCFPLLLLLNDMLVFLMTLLHLKSFHVARSVNAA